MKNKEIETRKTLSEYFTKEEVSTLCNGGSVENEFATMYLETPYNEVILITLDKENGEEIKNVIYK